MHHSEGTAEQARGFDAFQAYFSAKTSEMLVSRFGVSLPPRNGHLIAAYDMWLDAFLAKFTPRAHGGRAPRFGARKMRRVAFEHRADSRRDS